MARRMLIDATHPEETRVVVLNGNRLEEYDFETSTKKQIKGNIYLARVTRVEPSLQAAFVEYGGNRHGFLAFSEVHPDYYRIPVSDREAMLAAEAAADAESDFGDEEQATEQTSASEIPHELPDDIPVLSTDDVQGADTVESIASGEGSNITTLYADALSTDRGYDDAVNEFDPSIVETIVSDEPLTSDDNTDTGEIESIAELAKSDETKQPAEAPVVLETVGGDEFEEVASRPRVRHYRNYKIQEVIKRHQILLIQVNKEERGNKGAALTTYLSLAGRYCVLMPNAGRGGGVSRKITSAADRRRLKDLMEELAVPEGMGVIVRTAGSERSQAEIKRDYEYLLRLWDDIRELTLRSSAPALIYEEGSLIKRAIRDLYSRDIEEILVEGEDGYRTAKEFMRMLMPSHTSRVRPYRDPSIPLFHRFQVDAQIDEIHNPVVQLRSGGYIVINPTEALVSIDVNSGRSTRERNIEETATKTNIEAAEEIARQLRLRDLAGLVVIDFIDMEDLRNQKSVEAKLKDAMKSDRARIQLGRISPFGLLELSRQRLRSSLLEASTQICVHCNGTGTIRSTEATTLVVLRALEEEGIRRRTAEMTVYVPGHIALYILNQKREALVAIEQRYGFRVTVAQDDTLIPPAYRLDRLSAFTPAQLAALPVLHPPVWEDDEEEQPEEEAAAAAPTSADSEAEAEEAVAPPRSDEDRPKRRRRRRKRRRPGELTEGSAEDGDTDISSDEGDGGDDSEESASETAESVEGSADHAVTAPTETTEETAERKRRRRGRRGGQRRHRDEEQVAPVTETLDDILPYQSPFDFARDGRVESFSESDEGLAPLPVQSTEPADIPVEETAVEEATEAPALKRRRPARSKTSPAEPTIATASEEASVEAIDEVKPARRARTRKKPVEISEAEISAVQTPIIEAPVTEAPLEAAETPVIVIANNTAEDTSPPESADDENRPRRSGWWKRLIS